MGCDRLHTVCGTTSAVRLHNALEPSACFFHDMAQIHTYKKAQYKVKTTSQKSESFRDGWYKKPVSNYTVCWFSVDSSWSNRLINWITKGNNLNF